MAGAFEKLEEEKIGRGTHERLHTLMNKLEADIRLRRSQREQEKLAFDEDLASEVHVDTSG